MSNDGDILLVLLFNHQHSTTHNERATTTNVNQHIRALRLLPMQILAMTLSSFNVKNIVTCKHYMSAIEHYACLSIVPHQQQSFELCLAAVQRDGRALQFVEHQIPELCLVAVQEWGHALEYVRHQTPELCLAAIRRTKDASKHVRDQNMIATKT